MFKKPGLMCFFLFFAVSAMAGQAATIGGFSPEEAMRLGERMYREGILPSGEPMQALVQVDIPVEGTMFTCDNCHLTSGLGTVEGTIITLPTNGAKLYRTLRVGAENETNPARMQLSKPFQGGDIRPAYNDETLAEALWNGVSPTGRELDWNMPRYLLEDDEMDIMVYYLKNLSAEYSPGVTDKAIRFATVVAEGVPPEDQAAMLDTLQAVVKDHNSQSRHEEAKASKGPFYKQDKFRNYRRFALDVWELKGPRETWPAQLEAYYRKAPVFALLGGIVTGQWAPVHAFCESYKIPCIFPVTEAPVIAEDNWYTLYFSKGPYREGEAAAKFLMRSADILDDGPLVQIVDGTHESRMLARGFQETREKLGMPRAEVVTLDGANDPGPDFSRNLVDRFPGAAFLFWTGPAGLRVAEHLVRVAGEEPVLFFSSRLLDQELYQMPEKLRSLSFITHPYRVPQEQAKYLTVTREWLRGREVPVTNLPIQSRIYFLGWMLTGTVRMMGDDFYRDYFLDVLDMMRDEHYAIAVFPRLSFGPGQRYASKGCYITRASEGQNPELIPVSDWVIH